MSNKTTLFLALLTSILMVGCNASKQINVTSLSSLQKSIENTQTQMQKDGYSLSDIRKENHLDQKEDTYTFSTTNDNTIEYTIAYILKEYEGLYYVENVNVAGCKVSKKEDYNKYCGFNAPIRQIEQLPKDATAREFSQGKLIFNSIGIPSIIFGGLSFGSILLYTWLQTQYYSKK